MTEKIAMAGKAAQPSFLLVKELYRANFLSELNPGQLRPCATTEVGGAHD